MANPEHVEQIGQGVDGWNTWRQEHSEIRPDLREAHLEGVTWPEVDLSGADLSNANLTSADLTGADLRTANLSNANLKGTHSSADEILM